MKNLLLFSFLFSYSFIYTRDFLVIDFDKRIHYQSNPTGKSFVFDNDLIKDSYSFSWQWSDKNNCMVLYYNTLTRESEYIPKLGNNSLLVIDMSDSVHPVIKEYSLSNLYYPFK